MNAMCVLHKRVQRPIQWWQLLTRCICQTGISVIIASCSRNSYSNEIKKKIFFFVCTLNVPSTCYMVRGRFRNCIVLSTVASIGLRSWGSASFGRGGGDGESHRREVDCCCHPGWPRLSPPMGVPLRWCCWRSPELMVADHSLVDWGFFATWPSHSGTKPAWTT
jgi:hypothetical protein